MQWSAVKDEGGRAAAHVGVFLRLVSNFKTFVDFYTAPSSCNAVPDHRRIIYLFSIRKSGADGGGAGKYTSIFLDAVTMLNMSPIGDT